MTEDLVTAAVHLADVLQRENAALAALDLPHAATLVTEKHTAFDAFARARANADAKADTSLSTPNAREVASRLRDLSLRNRTLLERAISVQTRVIGVIAKALPPAEQRYASTGGRTNPAWATAFTLSARA